MRRLYILFYWITGHRNNVTFIELMRFLFKPKIHTIAKEYIQGTSRHDDRNYAVRFRGIDTPMFWPVDYSLQRLDQVVCETFDPADWHYYQKPQTQVGQGEIILDVGTAEGLFPLVVIGKCDHIYMIEPGRQFSENLELTFSDYKDKVTVFNVAVGSFDGEIPFDENSLNGKVSEDATASYTIPIRKVDSLMQGRKITYLKADIEGFEAEMIKGAEQTIRQNKPKIAITTYHDQNDPVEIVSLIKSFVPEYKHCVKGIYELNPKPVMIHFWI